VARPVEMRTFPTATNVVGALLARQVDNALLVDSVARDLVSRRSRQGSSNRVGHGPHGTRLPQQDGGRCRGQALDAMRADGAYQALFDKFGLTACGRSADRDRRPGPA